MMQTTKNDRLHHWVFEVTVTSLVTSLSGLSRNGARAKTGPPPRVGTGEIHRPNRPYTRAPECSVVSRCSGPVMVRQIIGPCATLLCSPRAPAVAVYPECAKSRTAPLATIPQTPACAAQPPPLSVLPNGHVTIQPMAGSAAGSFLHSREKRSTPCAVLRHPAAAY